jgi:rubredoxin
MVQLQTVMSRATNSSQPGNREVPLTLVCEGCGEVYTPAEAQNIAVLSPGYARYTCPACGYVVRSVPPASGATDGFTESGLIPAIVPITDSDD